MTNNSKSETKVFNRISVGSDQFPKTPSRVRRECRQAILEVFDDKQ